MRTPTNIASETPLAGLEGYYDDFLLARNEDVVIMKEALLSSNYELIMKLAHKWKGFAAPYGFGMLGEMAIELENCANASESLASSKLIDEADSYLKTKKKG